MADDYVPYEERQRRASEQQSATAAAAASAHTAAVNAVRAQLDRLRGASTNSYLELLAPARGLFKHRKPIVQKIGAMGGPAFHISGVVKAYRVADAIYHPPYKDASGYLSDAFLAIDGRVWEFRGRGQTENTWQVLAQTSRPVDELATEDLNRVHAALERLAL